ncbi:hypothetical protein [Kribbella sp. NPDC004536]|uniref:hypothetical protein n=1 Tax=Kribbella sp. NPDC004536 TaxID=3364106 RepID=UPI003677C147
MAQDNDAEQLRSMVNKALGGVVDQRPRREPVVAAEPAAAPPTFEQQVATAVQNAPEYVEAVQQARDAAAAARRSMDQIDLIPDTLRLDQPLTAPNNLTVMLLDRGDDANHRLGQAADDWNDRLTRGQEHLAEATTHLDTAATALAGAIEHRSAAATPGMLPSTGARVEQDLTTMANDLKAAQDQARFLGERFDQDLTTLKYDVLGKADNPPPDWHSDIRDAASSIQWTDNLRGGAAARLESASTQLDGLASKLEAYAAEPAGSESVQSAAPSSEQDLRLRAGGKPVTRGQGTGK